MGDDAGMDVSTFTVKGTIGGKPVTVTWTDGVFEPDWPTDALIAGGTQVCATATGPCFPAASSPAHVALLTVLEAFDEVTSITGADKAIAQLVELSAVPDGAVA